FSFHPVACAAGLAAVQLLKRERLVERCARLGRVLHERLAGLAQLPHVGDVRGRGLLAGIEFVEDKTTRTPFPRAARFAEAFTEALAGVRGQLGRDYALYIGGEPITSSAAPIVDTSPIDREIVLGRFASAGVQHVDRAVTAARAAQRGWAHTPWRARVATLRGAAGLIRQRKFELAAIMSLEVGKSRLESMGDAEESADLIDYYCQQVEDANGFIRQMAKVTPVERNTDVLRPYGVFACIAPFNFPLALSTGMSAAALVAGN